jgi:pyrroloquinoline quinone biosynthesis protein E
LRYNEFLCLSLRPPAAQQDAITSTVGLCMSLTQTIKPALSRIKPLVEKTIIKSAPLVGYYAPLELIRCIDVEPIATCNLKCDFCQVPGWDRARKTKPMDVPLFKKIVVQFPRLRQIKLQGMGEPFLNRKLPEMIRITSDMNIDSTVITNGTVLSLEMISKILDADLTNISFSFDGATKDTYERMRPGADYDEVTSNIKNLCIEKNKRNSKLYVRIQCLVSDETVLGEIPDLVRLASDLGIDTLEIKQRLKLWEKTGDDTYQFDTVQLKTYSKLDEILEEAGGIAKERGLNFCVATDAVYTSSNPCRWPWVSLYVSTEGKVVPCCALGVPETWTMGDLTKETLKEIWNNKAYRQLRKQISQNKVSTLCAACYERE